MTEQTRMIGGDLAIIADALKRADRLASSAQGLAVMLRQAEVQIDALSLTIAALVEAIGDTPADDAREDDDRADPDPDDDDARDGVPEEASADFEALPEISGDEPVTEVRSCAPLAKPQRDLAAAAAAMAKKRAEPAPDPAGARVGVIAPADRAFKATAAEIQRTASAGPDKAAPPWYRPACDKTHVTKNRDLLSMLASGEAVTVSSVIYNYSPPMKESYALNVISDVRRLLKELQWSLVKSPEGYFTVERPNRTKQAGE